MRTRKKKIEKQRGASNHCYFLEFGTKNDQDYHFLSRNGLEDLLGRFSGRNRPHYYGVIKLSKLTAYLYVDGVIPDAKIQNASWAFRPALLLLLKLWDGMTTRETFASQHVLSFDRVSGMMSSTLFIPLWSQAKKRDDASMNKLARCLLFLSLCLSS